MAPSFLRRALAACLLAASQQTLVAAVSLGGPRGIQLNNLADRGFNADGTRMGDAPALKAAVAAANETILPEYVTLPLDHFGSHNGTFKNRFWVAESGYKPGGPIFIYDYGEADASVNALFRLQDPTSFFKQIVDAYGGIGIVWEHRYYGESTPVEINLDTPADDFVWLTTEQALADVPAFAAQFSRKNFPDVDLTPDGTPWVFVGGSYPGMRAAFMREKYPDTIFASYASSAPVEARVDMSVYFEPVYRGLNRYGFGNCSNDIVAAIKYMDKAMQNDFAAAKLKEQFLGPSAPKNGNAEFADALTVIFWYWQSYGVEGGSVGLRRFCDWISTDPATNQTSGADGWAKSKGANFTVSRWSSWPTFTSAVSDGLNTTCSKNTTDPGDCDLGLRFVDPSSISWTWQYCTEWGFFQSANLGPNQVVSSFNSLKHQHDICHRQFPNATSDIFPDWPKTDSINRRLGGWDIRPSNTYWSGGEFDPWRTLSPLSSEPFAPHPELTQEIPECGETTSKDKIFAYVIPDAQHCYDFRTTFAGGAPSRKIFTDSLTKWLKCFKPSGGY